MQIKLKSKLINLHFWFWILDNNLLKINVNHENVVESTIDWYLRCSEFLGISNELNEWIEDVHDHSWWL